MENGEDQVEAHNVPSPVRRFKAFTVLCISQCFCFVRDLARPVERNDLPCGLANANGVISAVMSIDLTGCIVNVMALQRRRRKEAAL